MLRFLKEMRYCATQVVHDRSELQTVSSTLPRDANLPVARVLREVAVGGEFETPSNPSEHGRKGMQPRRHQVHLTWVRIS